MAYDKPLDLLTTVFAKKVELVLRFNSFGKDAQSEVVCHLDHRSGDRGVPLVCRDVSNEGLVNFQRIDGILLQMTQ